MEKTVQAELAKIAKLRSGYTYREKPVESPGSTVRMLQIRDLNESGLIDPSTLPEIDWQAKDTGFLQPDEIVFAARGIHNRAAQLDTSSPKALDKVAPSNQLLILTPQTNFVLPQYLCWVLNYPATQKQIQDRRTGTSMPSISKRQLAEVTVPLPSMQIQHKVVQLHQLREKEKAVLAELEINREAMLGAIYQKLLKGTE